MIAPYAEIYASFSERCPGIQFEGDWRFLHPDDDCRFADDETGELIEHLQEEFETDQLLASRLVVRADNEQLHLNPRLLTEDRLFVVLRNAQHQIFDIFTSAGSLSGRRTLLLLRQDAAAKEAIASQRRMFLTPSMADVVLFRSLGLAATCAADVVGLSRHGLQRLLWLVGGNSYGPIPREPIQFSWEGQYLINESGYLGRSENAPIEFELVLCAFSLYTHSREIPADIAPAARHLAHAETYLSISWDGVAVWWPTVDEMSNLAYRLELQEPDLLRDYLTQEHEFCGVEHFTDPSRPPASTDTFVDALEKLDQAFLDAEQHYPSECYLEKEREAFAKYESELEKTMIRPLLDSAIALHNPSIRPLRAQLAHVSKMLHLMMPRMHYAQKKQLHAGVGGVFPGESLKNIRSLTELMIKLVKEEHGLRK